MSACKQDSGSSCLAESFISTSSYPSCNVEAVDASQASSSCQMVIHGAQNRQLAPAAVPEPSYITSFLKAWEKSNAEQTRCNDLKSIEIALRMQCLKVDQAHLDLHTETNTLERFKISMNMTKAALKEEELRTHVLDKMYVEFMRKCSDSLVAGLLIVCTCLLYGAFAFSYDRLFEATFSCSYSSKESKSWWIQNPMTSILAGINVLRCHAILWIRMLFGVTMILAVAYILLQRPSTSRQTMPVTFILLLLGAICGFSGKLCVDSLGGNGICWVCFWESFCMLHFSAAIFNQSFCSLLHGYVSLCSEASRNRMWVPYWARRVVFYGALFLLPVFCGLLPFASIYDWVEHFASLAWKRLAENAR